MSNNKFERFFLTSEIIILLISGLISSFVLTYLLLNNYTGLMLVSSIIMTFSVIFLITYGTFDLGNAKLYLLLSMLLFISAIIINIVLPFRNIFQQITLSLMLILMILIIVFNKKYLVSIILFTALLFISLSFSLYSSCIASTDNLNNSKVVILSEIAMHFSIASPTILVLSYFIIYYNRHKYL